MLFHLIHVAKLPLIKLNTSCRFSHYQSVQLDPDLGTRKATEAELVMVMTLVIICDMRHYHVGSGNQEIVNCAHQGTQMVGNDTPGRLWPSIND